MDNSKKFVVDLKYIHFYICGTIAQSNAINGIGMHECLTRDGMHLIVLISLRLRLVLLLKYRLLIVI